MQEGVKVGSVIAKNPTNVLIDSDPQVSAEKSRRQRANRNKK